VLKQVNKFTSTQLPFYLWVCTVKNYPRNTSVRS